MDECLKGSFDCEGEAYSSARTLDSHGVIYGHFKGKGAVRADGFFKSEVQPGGIETKAFSALGFLTGFIFEMDCIPSDKRMKPGA